MVIIKVDTISGDERYLYSIIYLFVYRQSSGLYFSRGNDFLEADYME